MKTSITTPTASTTTPTPLRFGPELALPFLGTVLLALSALSGVALFTALAG